MRLIGLLAVFDENPMWVAGAISSSMSVGLDHLVVVDGAYELYPDGTRSSGAEMNETVLQIAHACGMGVTMHVPDRLWKSEIEKRNYMFELAEHMATPGEDWYVVFDADEIFMRVATNVKDVLKATEHDVATAKLVNLENPATSHFLEKPVEFSRHKRPNHYQMRMFFRAIPGLRCGIAHSEYMTPDGRVMWGPLHSNEEPAEELPVVVEHKSQLRPPERVMRARAYYRLRDELRVERGKCAHCDERAVVVLPKDFALRENTELIEWRWEEVCESHVYSSIQSITEELKGIGLDPIVALADVETHMRNEGLDPAPVIDMVNRKMKEANANSGGRPRSDGLKSRPRLEVVGAVGDDRGPQPGSGG